MVKSYLKAYQVLGDRRVREFALKTLERLHQERYRQGRGVAHLVKAGRPEKFGLLADQVYVAEALLEAFLTTGVSVYLQQAEQIMTDLSARLEDTQGGGFYDRPPDDAAHGLLKFPHKDLEINASLGILYSDLYYVTQKPAYRDTAEQTIQFVLGHSGPLPVARTGRAVNRLLEYPVQIVVVGNKREVQAQKLFRKGLEVYAPGKLVRFLDPEVDRLSLGEVTFPRLPEPRAYVCTDRLCSSPIRTIEELTFGLNDVLALIFPAQGHNTGFAGTSTR